MKAKIFLLVTIVAMLMCMLPSCGDDSERGPKIVNAMLYVGDMNKQGYCITIEGNTLDYQTKLALTTENFEAKKMFIETFGKEDCVLTLEDKQVEEYFSKLTDITSSWESFYTPAEDTKIRQYWFVEVYYDNGDFHNYSGYEAWPENYGEYITLTQQLCGKLFPEKIDAYMPEDIATEQAATTTTPSATTVAPAA